MIRDRNATGNSRFEGYLIDLITTLSVRLKFDFELYEVEDGNYGTQNASGEWNGMIGDLISGVRTLRRFDKIVQNLDRFLHGQFSMF